jgi:hypothetical protein
LADCRQEAKLIISLEFKRVQVQFWLFQSKEESERLLKETREMKKWRKKAPKRSILSEIGDFPLPRNLPTFPFPEWEAPPEKKIKQDASPKEDSVSSQIYLDKPSGERSPTRTTPSVENAKTEKPKKVGGKKAIQPIKGQMKITSFFRL